MKEGHFMFTKKTRILSALLSVCMLISVMACVVIPASAEEYTPYVEGELYSATGLVDVTGLDDIATDWNADVKEYQVTNRAGFEKINELVLGGNTLAGYTFTMANDVDFGWKNFPGIGLKNTGATPSFAGVFNGNGFVVEQLLISAPYSDNVGLFAHVSTGFAVKNLGIASGLVVGGNDTGALVGWSTGYISVYNCWNAATVITSSDSGALVGALNNNTGKPASKIYNSYNLGLLMVDRYGGPVFGTAHSNYQLSVKNSYNYGVMIQTRNEATNQTAYASFGRTRLAAASFSGNANNAAVVQEQGFTTGYEHISDGGTVTAANDQAVEFAKADFTGDAIIARLNTSVPATDLPTGYTVQYDVVEGLGYPVLTYYKDGEAVIRRVAHTEDNIGENTLAEKVDFFKTFCEGVRDYVYTDIDLGVLEIDSAEDLMALSFIMYSRDNKEFVSKTHRLTTLGVTKLSFTSDIDMKDCTLFAGDDGKCGLDAFLPIGVGEAMDANASTSSWTALNVPVEGNGHIIKNWSSVIYSGYGTDLVGALFGKVDPNVSISDLGMENANVVYSVRDAVSDVQHTRYGIMVGKVGNQATTDANHVFMSNCWVTGKLTVTGVTGLTGYAQSGPGSLIAWDAGTKVKVQNSWANVDVEHLVYPKYTKAPATGYGTQNALTNVYYVADEDDTIIGPSAVIAAQKMVPSSELLKFSYDLNQVLKAAGKSQYYGMNANGTNPTWVAEADQTRKVTLIATKANNTEYVAYGKAGDTVNLLTLLGAEEANFEVVSETGSVENGIFTIGAGDGEVTTDLVMVSDADYVTLKAIYDQKSTYWDKKGIGDLLTAIGTKLAEDKYSNQAEMNADIEEVAPLFVAEATDKVPASAAFEAVTLDCGVTVPSFAMPGDAVYKNIGIYDIQDLLYVRDIQADSYTGTKYAADQTLYLCENLDLTDATDFVGIWNLASNFDGQNKTVSNFNTNTFGFFMYPKNDWIKNLRFYSCEATIGSRGALVVYQLYSDGNEHTLENIIIEDCTLTAASGSNGIAAVVGMNRSEDNDHILRNITVRGTVLNNKGSATAASGFIVSLIRFGGDFNMENILIENCENRCGKADGVGFVFGSIDQESGSADAPLDEHKISIDGLIVRNNRGVYVDGEKTYSIQTVLGGMWQRTTAAGLKLENYLTVKNAQIYGNDAGEAPLVAVNPSSVTNGHVVLENVYTDVTNTAYPSVDPQKLIFTTLNTADFANGKSVYLHNTAAKKTVFVADASGNIYFAAKAPANATAPVKVSFVDAEGAEKLAYYTGNGAMIKADQKAVDALYDCKLLDAEGAEMDLAAVMGGTYTADTVYTVTNHVLSYAVVGDGKHNVTCAECDYDEDLNCNTELDSELEKQVFEPTEDEEGYTLHKCSLCEDEWKGEILPKVIGVKTDLENNSVSVETLTIPVALKNNPNLKGMEVNVQYDANRLALKDLDLNDADALVDKGGEDGNYTYVIAKATEIASFDETITAEKLAVLFKLEFVPVAGAVGDTEVKVNVEVVDDVTDYEYLVNNLTVALIDTDLDAAEAVDALIGDLTVQSLDDKPAVEAARAAYDTLTDSQKALVKKLPALEIAEALIADYQAAADQEAADKAAAARVSEAIAALGEITLASGEIIAQIKADYEALTDAQKALVTNYADLLAAEEAYNALVKDEQNKVAAAPVIALIEQIGEVTPESEEAIKAAREAYEALTDEQKVYVNNVSVLEAAEAALADLKVEAAKNNLAEKINAAEVQLKETTVAENASEVANGKEFVTSANAKALQAAIEVAKAALEKDASVEDYNNAAQEIVNATAEFVAAKQTGTYVAIVEADCMDGDFLYKDDVRINAYTLAKLGEDIYFVYDYHKILKDATVYVGETYLVGTDFTPGYYTFDKNGVMSKANGVSGDYYYQDGARVGSYQLITDGTGTYYVNDHSKLAKNQAVFVTINDVYDCYYFGADGKLGGDVIYNGYAFKDGKRVPAYNVVEIEGATYYVSDGHKIAKSGAHWVTVGDYTGYHYFDEDGKLSGDGLIDGYVYKNGVRQLAYQLVEVNGDYYFVNDGHRATVSKKIYLSAYYVADIGLEEGWYNFDENGKMVK